MSILLWTEIDFSCSWSWSRVTNLGRASLGQIEWYAEEEDSITSAILRRAWERGCMSSSNSGPSNHFDERERRSAGRSSLGVWLEKDQIAVTSLRARWTDGRSQLLPCCSLAVVRAGMM